MKTREEIEKKLVQIEAEIREAEQRLPAHSTKPATMRMLLDLEDKRDELLAAIRALDEEPTGQAADEA